MEASFVEQDSKSKIGPRAKKALKSIPEDLAMKASFVEQGSKIVSDEVKEVSELCANEVKPYRGKRSARAKENDQRKLRTEREEEQQVKEPQQEKMITCHKASRKRGGLSMLAPEQSITLPPIQAPGNLSKKATDCLSMPTEKRDPLSALMACTQEPTKPESKKDHVLNVRSSTRAKKVVYYNEQSPRRDLNEKKVFVSTELKAQAATKRNASAAKLIPGGAKRVKEDPTSTAEETSALDSAKAISVKRGRRRQKSSSPQKLLDKKSVAFRGTGNVGECKEHQKESNLEQGNSSSAFFNSLDLDSLSIADSSTRECQVFNSTQC